MRLLYNSKADIRYNSMRCILNYRFVCFSLQAWVCDP